MPYDVRKTDKCPSSKPWGVVNKDSGKVHGCHDTKSKAERQRRAILANTDEEHHSSPRPIPQAPFGRL